jgi:hypothetical protein
MLFGFDIDIYRDGYTHLVILGNICQVFLRPVVFEAETRLTVLLVYALIVNH